MPNDTQIWLMNEEKIQKLFGMCLVMGGFTQYAKIIT
jgi:hypothetical protein